MSSSWRHSCCCWNLRRADDVWHKCLARREFFHTSIFLLIEIPPSYSVLCQTKVELNTKREARGDRLFSFLVLGFRFHCDASRSYFDFIRQQRKATTRRLNGNFSRKYRHLQHRIPNLSPLKMLK